MILTLMTVLSVIQVFVAIVLVVGIKKVRMTMWKIKRQCRILVLTMSPCSVERFGAGVYDGVCLFLFVRSHPNHC